MAYYELDWDTNFFGFKVAKVETTKFNDSEFNELLKLLKNKGIELVYASFNEKIDDNNNILKEYEIKLVDEKVTFLKRVDKDCFYEENVVSYDLKYPTEQMLKLAIESGEFSRFNFDKRIGKKKFEELYKIWMVNSVNLSIARETLVYRERDEILGMVTLSEKNGRGDVGIIAVDKDKRGKGIGKALMNSAEKWIFDNNYNDMQVVTQGFNIPACNLYEKRGFSKDKVEFFYHCWLKN